MDFIGERRETCACRDKLNALQITGDGRTVDDGVFYERLLPVLSASYLSRMRGGALISMAEFVEVCSFDEEDMIDALWDEAVSAFHCSDLRGQAEGGLLYHLR